MYMKEQQFESQVRILREHHKNIQIRIHQQIQFVQAADKEQAQQKANEISSLTYNLFNYCERLLHVSNQEATKCELVKKKLVQVFEKNRLSAEKIKMYQQKLKEAERKIEDLLIENVQLQKANKALKAEVKLSGVITSFTFKDEDPASKNQKFQNSQINNQSSIYGSQPHEASVCSQASQVQKVELYVSYLQQLNFNLDCQENEKPSTTNEIVEEQETKDKESTVNVEGKKLSSQTQAPQDAEANNEINI